MHKYYLGLDGGGTKTDVLLCDEEGNILSAGHAGASSMTGQSRDSARREIKAALEQALRPVGGLSAEISGFYAGISGAGLEKNKRVFCEIFAALLPNVRHVECGSDALNALSAGIGLSDGVIAIAGTGSSIFARKQGVMHQVGGWGYLIGDEGSGYDLGRRAVMSAYRSMDGRMGETALVRLCEEKIGMTLRDWVPELYRQDGKAALSSFAPVLLRAAEAGDSTALMQLRESTRNMACSIRTACGIACSRQVVLAGSIWKNVLYRAQVHAELGQDYSLIQPDVSPVCGSVVLAWAQDGLNELDARREKMKRNLNNMQGEK